MTLIEAMASTAAVIALNLLNMGYSLYSAPLLKPPLTPPPFARPFE